MREKEKNEPAAKSFRLQPIIQSCIGRKRSNKRATNELCVEYCSVDGLFSRIVSGHGISNLSEEYNVLIQFNI